MIVQDQMGNDVQIPEKEDLRIVSIVPSQTELLHYLGANVVGQTVFCVHPEDRFKKAVKVGGTKRLQISKILNLQPDLIIGNKEENDQAQIEKLRQHFPVWMSDIYSIDDALGMIETTGHIINKKIKSKNLINNILTGFDKLNSSIKDNGSVVYIIWKDPFMVAGRQTFINSILEKAGLTNVCSEPNSRYPEITLVNLKEWAPDHVLLSSEPFPFKTEHILYFQEHLPESHVSLADGTYFSWYGSRLKDVPAYLKASFPQLFK